MNEEQTIKIFTETISHVQKIETKEDIEILSLVLEKVKRDALKFVKGHEPITTPSSDANSVTNT